MTTLGLLTARSAGGVELPGPLAAGARSRSPIEAAIEAQPVCVGSTVQSFGELGGALLYRAERRADGRVEVGYYVFYSEERPWGNNWLTWTIVPALAVDLVYTRTLMVAPGAQRLLYGKGDVEGFRILYDPLPGGGLRALSGASDDTYHRPARLERAELFSLDPRRLTVFTEGWNHHLGAHGARARDLASLRCYEPGSIRPLTPEIARDFHLERRAGPASEQDVEGSDRAAAPEGEVVNPEDHHRAEDGHEEPSRRLIGGIESEGSTEKTAHQGAGDAEERREDESARLSPRREQLGNHPDDQTEHDPEHD
jgi:hypothetical protein